jgi:hypothetical protein
VKKGASDEEKEIINKMDQHEEFLPASIVDELKQIRDRWYNKYKRNKTT